MSARDDYPALRNLEAMLVRQGDGGELARALDELDRLRLVVAHVHTAIATTETQP